MSDKAVADQAAACLFRQDPFIWGEGPLDLLYPEEGDLYITYVILYLISASRDGSQ